MIFADIKSSSWDHLHMRGEYVMYFVSSLRRIGSPPHAWRIQTLYNPDTVAMRITSTCVENTLLLKRKKETNKDHLHMRGEYYKQKVKQGFLTGSPPHAWRILLMRQLVNHLSRITSTCVENTLSGSVSSSTVWDHLHMRGEYTKETPSLSHFKFAEKQFFFSLYFLPIKSSTQLYQIFFYIYLSHIITILNYYIK